MPSKRSRSYVMSELALSVVDKHSKTQPASQTVSYNIELLDRIMADNLPDWVTNSQLQVIGDAFGNAVYINTKEFLSQLKQKIVEQRLAYKYMVSGKDLIGRCWNISDIECMALIYAAQKGGKNV